MLEDILVLLETELHVNVFKLLERQTVLDVYEPVCRVCIPLDDETVQDKC